MEANLKTTKLGVFDSGLGGLTVLNEICKYNRGLDIVYFGDTARVPYGSRSNETILSYARQDVRFLKKQAVDAIVVACGTVSSIALNDLKANSDIPIIGVLETAVQAALEHTKSQFIGVIGTPATIRSGAYERLITQNNPSCRCKSVPCPLLVPLIENGHAPSDAIVELACRRYLDELLSTDCDTVIMGCTHYPFYESTLRTLAPDIEFINIGTALSLKLSGLMPLRLGKDTTVEYFVSDADTGFQSVANGFLDAVKAQNIKSINIEQY